MASAPQPGTPAPDFTLPGGVLTDDGFPRKDYALAEHRGAPLVLAFYPGDRTAVCTKQLCSYSRGLEAFTALGAQVWGISPQDVDSHEDFARASALRFPLLADTGRSVARAFGVAAPGIGLRRAVFLVGPDGTVRWRHISLLGATYRSLETLTRRLEALNAESGRGSAGGTAEPGTGGR